MLYLVDPGTPVTSGRRLLLAGLLLGATLTLRLQLAPAAAVILLWSAVGEPRGRLLPLVAGLAAALALAGALDVATWGYPFQSMWLNFVYNTYNGVSSFGTEPWTFYAQLLLGRHHRFAGSARRHWRATTAAALSGDHGDSGHAFAHSPQGASLHFIYPAILPLLIVAGVGMAQIGVWMADRGLIRHRVGAIGLVAASAFLSRVLASSPNYQELWRRGHDIVQAAVLRVGARLSLRHRHLWPHL